MINYKLYLYCFFVCKFTACVAICFLVGLVQYWGFINLSDYQTITSMKQVMVKPYNNTNLKHIS